MVNCEGGVTGMKGTWLGAWEKDEGLKDWPSHKKRILVKCQ